MPAPRSPILDNRCRPGYQPSLWTSHPVHGDRRSLAVLALLSKTTRFSFVVVSQVTRPSCGIVSLVGSPPCFSNLFRPHPSPPSKKNHHQPIRQVIVRQQNMIGNVLPLVFQPSRTSVRRISGSMSTSSGTRRSSRGGSPHLASLIMEDDKRLSDDPRISLAHLIVLLRHDLPPSRLTSNQNCNSRRRGVYNIIDSVESPPIFGGV